MSQCIVWAKRGLTVTWLADGYWKTRNVVKKLSKGKNMTDKETSTTDDKLNSLRMVMDQILKAMQRVKMNTEDMEQRTKILEASNTGLVERVENLENAFREAFTKSEENLKAFLAKAAEAGTVEDDEAEETA